MDEAYENGIWVDGEFYHNKSQPKRKFTKDDAIYGIFSNTADEPTAVSTKPMQFVKTSTLVNDSSTSKPRLQTFRLSQTRLTTFPKSFENQSLSELDAIKPEWEDHVKQRFKNPLQHGISRRRLGKRRIRRFQTHRRSSTSWWAWFGLQFHNQTKETINSCL